MSLLKYNIDNELGSGSDIDKYLKERNLDSEIIKKYEIGYVGRDNQISNYLVKKGFTEAEVIQAGLAKNNDGKLQDYFVNRIMFPIQDEVGNIVGFSGRALSKDAYAKYLNTPETKAFKKTNVLYNLNRAKSPISLSKEAIVVEGFMDVIAYDKIGLSNVVATMGTAFTKVHIDKIKTLTNNVVLSFDNDIAGINTTIKSGKELIGLNVNLSVIKLDGFKDLDEFLAKSTNEEVLKVINTKSLFVDFYLEVLIKQTKDTPNFEAIKSFVKMVEKLNDDIQINFYINKAAEAFGIDKEVLQPKRNNRPQNDYVEYMKPIEKSFKTKQIKNDNDSVKKYEMILLGLGLESNFAMNILKTTNYYFNNAEIKADFKLFSEHGVTKDTIDSFGDYKEKFESYFKLIEEYETDNVAPIIIEITNRLKELTLDKSKKDLLAELKKETDPEREK